MSRYERIHWFLVLFGVLLLGVLVVGGQAQANEPFDTLLSHQGELGELRANKESVAQARKGKRKRRNANKGPKVGWIRIYTTDDASVTVDDKPYPYRKENGMMVSANERHNVKVKLGDKEKTYVIAVRPREMRTLMVGLDGYQAPGGGGKSTTKSTSYKAPTSNIKQKEEDGAESGKLTVYSKPKGEVFVDGEALGATTPMINRELDLGRHEVQVKWDSGDMSEVKTIRIRKGSKLKLFFRDRNKNK